MPRKFKILIEYDGSRYHGWQIQPNGTTIQEILQDCLYKIVREKTSVVGSGRTDAGVHAEGQVAHFRTNSGMTSREFLMAFNSLLPYDIAVKQVEEVPGDFHAQRSAVRKIYRYMILNRLYPSALHHHRCWFIQAPLDLRAMRKGAKYLVGEHDFSAMRASSCEAKSPVRTIHRIDIRKNGDFVALWFEGNGFLKHMVRNMVGTLVQVGRKKIKPSEVGEIMDSRDRSLAGPTAQPQGLCLVEVIY